MESLMKFAAGRLQMAETQRQYVETFKSQVYGAFVYYLENHPNKESELIAVWEDLSMKFDALKIKTNFEKFVDTL